jgi:multiple sugar transport system substrate-binding protein
MRPVWDFIDFYCAQKGQSIYMKPSTSLPTQKTVLADPKLIDPSAQFFVDELKYSTSRPPLPVSNTWWDAMDDAQESVLLGSATPQEAVDKAQARVGPEMQTYCPFTLPKGYGTVS